MRVLSKVFFVATIVSLGWVNSVAATAVSLLDYQFPASSSNLVTNTTVDDLGSGNHDATPSGFTGTGLSSTVPPGQTGSSASFSGGQKIFTKDSRLLNTNAVAAAGGFTYDVWFRTPSPLVNQKMIDYAGTDNLLVDKDTVRFALNDGQFRCSTPILANTWYHAVATFDTTGNTPVADPDYEGTLKIDGKATLFVNGTEVSSVNATKTGFGDFLDGGRPIGIGGHPMNGGENFTGELYNVKIFLGVASVPEPSAMLLLSTGVIGLLVYAWRRRQRCVTE